MNKRRVSIAILILWCAGCLSGPPVIPGKGNVFGILSAESHKDFLAKNTHTVEGSYSSSDTVVSYQQDMVNYPQLNELYVCLIDPEHRGGNIHSLSASENQMSAQSLALAVGDLLRIRNDTAHVQNFFLTDAGNGFQALPTAKPGEETQTTIQLQGILQLRTEENDALAATLFVQKGLIGKRVKSGDAYAFEGLRPGTYDLVFWYWRLGSIRHTVHIAADKNLRQDERLSVDRVVAHRLNKAP
jgi:hypothetical protein